MAQTVKNLPAMQETWIPSLVGKIPWRRKWLPFPVFFLGEPHGQRSLAGYSSWGPKEFDATERQQQKKKKKVTIYNTDRNVSSLRSISCTTIQDYCFLKKVSLSRIFKAFNLSVKESSMGIHSCQKCMKQGLIHITANPDLQKYYLSLQNKYRLFSKGNHLSEQTGSCVLRWGIFIFSGKWIEVRRKEFCSPMLWSKVWMRGEWPIHHKCYQNSVFFWKKEKMYVTVTEINAPPPTWKKNVLKWKATLGMFIWGEQSVDLRKHAWDPISESQLKGPYTCPFKHPLSASIDLKDC